VKPAIERTPDLLRVLGLPRRRLDLREATYLAAELTGMLALHPSEALRPWQGQILHEAMICGGVYAGAPVGLGKTLLGWLAPVVLDAQRPMLIIPGGLRPDTHAFYQAYLGRWRRCAAGIRVVSVDELSLVHNVDLLERERPDLVIIDEADTMRNPRSAAVKRMARYVGEYEPMVCAWTGTPGRLSIMDTHHLLVWCLKDRAPVPLRAGEAAFWGLAIDEASGYRAASRPHAGALALLGGGTELTGVRAAFRARLTESPGVVIVDGDSCDQPLTVRQIVAPSDPILETHFKTFRKKHVTPDGWPTSDALSEYRHAGELGSGMYLRWNPRPPQWWLGPRSGFCGFVRQVIDDDIGLDTELAVARAFPKDPAVTEWDAVKKKFTPNSEAVWLSDTVLKAVVAWLAESPEPSIVWTWNVAFGEALAAMTKLRYYGAGGLDRYGEHVSKIARAAGRPPSIIVSGQANQRGRNFQAWCRNGLVNPPRSSRYLEQCFGRTHRAGQTRPVMVDVFMTSGDTFDGFEASIRESSFGRDTFGITQKLLRANVVRATRPTDSHYRWRVKENQETS
jgi:hypothetical protein